MFYQFRAHDATAVAWVSGMTIRKANAMAVQAIYRIYCINLIAC
jgi:hypothetical protein